MKDVSDEKEFGPGQLLFFERRTVHSISKILEEPLTFLTVDAPRRDPKDIVFVDAKDGSAESFMARNA